MPQSDQNSANRSNVVNIAAAEAQHMLSDIRAFRQRTLLAWHERGVTFTEEERAKLRAEIAYTCELLTLLTSRG